MANYRECGAHANWQSELKNNREEGQENAIQVQGSNGGWNWSRSHGAGLGLVAGVGIAREDDDAVSLDRGAVEYGHARAPGVVVAGAAEGNRLARAQPPHTRVRLSKPSSGWYLRSSSVLPPSLLRTPNGGGTEEGRRNHAGTTEVRSRSPRGHDGGLPD